MFNCNQTNVKSATNGSSKRTFRFFRRDKRVHNGFHTLISNMKNNIIIHERKNMEIVNNIIVKLFCRRTTITAITTPLPLYQTLI